MTLQQLESSGSVASQETTLNRGVLKGVPFSRSRFLAGVGAALTAVATNVWFADAADAAVPNGCFGWDQCGGCSGTSCSGGCTAQKCCCPPDSQANQCWTSCAYEGSTLVRIRCCDWTRQGVNCICRGIVGAC